jgi:cation:H+ antiporter
MWNGTALVAGILLLYMGAEWLVKGAAGLGRSFGMRPLVVGLTVVAYGTSMPELVVSMVAGLRGSSGIALGNVIGSNIANLGLILGATVVIRPLAVEGSLIRRELPLMMGAALSLPILLADGVVWRPEALLLLGGAAGFTYLTARSSLPGARVAATLEADAETVGAPPGTGRLRLIMIGAVGLALLITGGQALITGATGIAFSLGISERVVGLTVAAIGTSAPELAASIVAAIRGHASIAIGNVIGSNIFNVLFVLGGVAMIRPLSGVFSAYAFDLAVLIGISMLALFSLRRKRIVGRVEGTVLLTLYAAYLLFLIRG